MRFRIAKTDIFISFWFFAVVALFASINAMAFSLYFALPVFVHETGHLLMMLATRTKVDYISLGAFGAEIRKVKSMEAPVQKEISVCLAGVLANGIFALCLYLFAFQSIRVMFLIAANVAVIIFNILPVGNLDGGEALGILCRHYFAPRTAYILSLTASFAVLVPLFAAAAYLLISHQNNFSLMLVCLYLACNIIRNA